MVQSERKLQAYYIQVKEEDEKEENTVALKHISYGVYNDDDLPCVCMDPPYFLSFFFFLFFRLTSISSSKKLNGYEPMKDKSSSHPLPLKPMRRPFFQNAGR